MPIREIYLADELEAGWIIALWKAIHGGDPGAEQIAAQAIAALAQYVAAPAQTSFTLADLKEQFGKLGVQVTERGKEAEGAKPQLAVAQEIVQREFRIHQYCFKFEGEIICAELPVLAHLPTAA